MQHGGSSEGCVSGFHVGGGVTLGCAAPAAPPPEHGPGAAAAGLTQGSRYEHPGISAATPTLSEGLFQPLPTSTVGVAAEPLGGVSVGAGSVGIGPVGV